jgi:hypothetical protein
MGTKSVSSMKSRWNVLSASMALLTARREALTRATTPFRTAKSPNSNDREVLFEKGPQGSAPCDHK